MSVRIEGILAPNPGVYTLEGTNTWVVGSEPSIVIDPGPDDEGHLRRVAEAAGEVAAILLTHGHEDHAPGVHRLRELTGADSFAFEPCECEEHLVDGQRFEVGGAVVEALQAPGHSPDSAAFFIRSEGALFTGDSVLGRGTSMIDAPEGVLVDYLTSLGRMLDLEPRTIYPGHGPIVEDAVGKLDEYLAHRTQRETQILEALAAGADTTRSIVERVYADHPADVLPLAERSVLAHLVKLESEGRVRSDREGYALI